LARRDDLSIIIAKIVPIRIFTTTDEKWECPDGYHSIEDDETGQAGCPKGYGNERFIGKWYR
jgi:hypothetical protein